MKNLFCVTECGTFFYSTNDNTYGILYSGKSMVAMNYIDNTVRWVGLDIAHGTMGNLIQEIWL